MAVTVLRIDSNGAEIEVIEPDGTIIVGVIPSEFFEDTLGNDANHENWNSRVTDNANEVEKAMRAKRDGGFINSRYKSFQFRETR